MKQSLILVVLIAGCASKPLSQVDIARANREKVCATESDSKCEAAMQQAAQAITKEQNDPNYQFQQKLNEITLRNSAAQESIRLNQQLLDMQLYGIGK